MDRKIVKNQSLFKKLSRTIISIDPELDLQEHGLFWLPVLFFILVASWSLYFSIPKGAEYSLSRPLEIIELLKVPATIFALCIPFTVAVGRFHGSSQRKKSNQMTEVMMYFKQYFEHRAAFTNHFEKHVSAFLLSADQFHLEIDDPLSMYGIIFPNSSMNNFDPSSKAGLLSELIANVNCTLNSIDSKHTNKYDNVRDLKKADKELFDIVNDTIKQFGLRINIYAKSPYINQIMGNLDWLFNTLIKDLIRKSTYFSNDAITIQEIEQTLNSKSFDTQAIQNTFEKLSGAFNSDET